MAENWSSLKPKPANKPRTASNVAAHVISIGYPANRGVCVFKYYLVLETHRAVLNLIILVSKRVHIQLE